jgi:small-conductance mechanosensitive channel
VSAARSRAAALLLLALAAAGPMRAQTPAAGSAPAAPAAPAAAPEAPATIPVGEISARAQAVADSVRALEATIEKAEERTALQADLERMSESLQPRAKETLERIAQTPTLAMLADLRDEWSSQERQIATREERLARVIDSLEREAERLNSERELWKRTRTYERERGTPAPTLESARVAAAELKRAADLVKQTLAGSLVLQTRFAELRALALATLASIDEAREGVLEHLLTRDHPALWQVNLFEEVGQIEDWPIARFLAEVRDRSIAYGERSAEGVALHALLFALLVWALRAAHAALRADENGELAPGDTATQSALLATQHPFAAALLLALLASPLLHHDLPNALRIAQRIAIVPPVVLVLRPLLGDALRAPLYLLATFFLVDQLREILTGGAAPGRMLFAVEMIVLTGVLAALLGRRRLERLPASVRGNRWLAGLGLWIRVSAAIAGIAALAGIGGYTRLANLLGGGVLVSGYAALGGYALLRIGEGLVAALLGGGRLSIVRMLAHHRALLLVRAGRLLRAGIFVGWLLVVLEFFALRDPLFRLLRALFGWGFGYGAFEFTLGGLLAFGLTLLGAWLFARLVHFVLDEEVFPRLGLAPGVPFALSTLARYAILLVGFLVALSALGFDLDRITILLGAFGVGIGFGLQTIVNNFVSGLILLFERPLKVGDSVEIGGLEGTVQRIGIRASTVRTFDGADVIVPNGMLVSERVVNWTLSDRTRRIVIPVGVAYGNDPQRVMRLLEGIVNEHPGLCRFPTPVVAFMGLGESALDFQVRAWIEDSDQLVDARSQLVLAIEAGLRGAGIEIPFPQRTVHLRREPPAASATPAPGSEPRPDQSSARE